MLYFRALERGLAALPAADPAIRRRLDDEAGRHGWAALHRRLAAVDPAAASRIHPTDPQRIQRALEVWERTGVPITELQRRAAEEPFPFRAVKWHVFPEDRAGLHRRIEERFRRMLELGFWAEVERLFARGDLNPSMPSIRAVGYRQLWQHLAGEVGREEAVRRGIVATRRLARRQLTWLRADRADETLPAGEPGAERAGRSIETILGVPGHGQRW